MKRKDVFWGLVLIFAAVLLIIDGIGSGLGILYDIPVVSIVLGVLCLAWAFSMIIKNKIYGVFFPLGFIFILFEKYIADFCGISGGQIMSTWVVLLAALLLTIGVKAVFYKPEIPKEIKRNWKLNSNSNNFGKSTKYIDSENFEYQYIENNMGSLDLYFENTDMYKGNGVLQVENNMGKMTLHIPYAWHVIDDCQHNMGTVQCEAFSNADGKVLTIKGECNMGHISIVGM